MQKLAVLGAVLALWRRAAIFSAAFVVVMACAEGLPTEDPVSMATDDIEGLVLGSPTAVDIDIKPGSCPNPLDVRGRGVLPVAIQGTDQFDVTQVDPASVQLEGVPPLRWDLEDVATPFAGVPEDANDCTEEGPDGFLDLTLKFGNQELVAALGPVDDGDVLLLTLTGNLKAEFGGTPIEGQDVVVIRKKGN